MKKEKIANCFYKCTFKEVTLELFIDDVEFAGLQNYISQISPDSIVGSYLNQDEHGVTSINTVDIHSINWKEDLREKAIHCVIEDDDETEKGAEADDNFDIEWPELIIWSTHAALTLVVDLNSFWEKLGDVDLVSALNLVTQWLETPRLKNILQKKLLNILTKLFNLILLSTSYMNIVIPVSCTYLMTHSQWKKLS